MLNAFLDSHRDTLEWKCSGLTSDQLKEAAAPPSPLTLLGLLRHMAEVEYDWFESLLLNRDEHIGLFSPEGSPRGEWTELDSHPAEDVLREWKQTCEISRRNVASIPELDALAARPRFWDKEAVTLRWMMIHMIEEYARHNGHADFLRERIDGETGE
jgi:uncharacterized damage-inducible protein DinB